MGKTENFDKVSNIVLPLENNVAFTNYDIEKKTGLHYNQIKKILLGLEELGEIKFIPSNKIYVRLKNGQTLNDNFAKVL